MRLRLDRPEGLTRSSWAIAHLLSRKACCPKDFAYADFYRYGARIHDLRHAGAVIDMRPCEKHVHPNGRQSVYVLTHVPESWLARVERATADEWLAAAAQELV